MKLAEVVRRIEIRLRELNRSEAEVSRAATGSTDTIRNWRRRVAKEKNPGAAVSKVNAIAAELGVTTAWLQGEGGDDFDGEQSLRHELMSIYDRLPDGPWRQHLLEDAQRVAASARELEDAVARSRKGRR